MDFDKQNSFLAGLRTLSDINDIPDYVSSMFNKDGSECEAELFVEKEGSPETDSVVEKINEQAYQLIWRMPDKTRYRLSCHFTDNNNAPSSQYLLFIAHSLALYCETKCNNDVKFAELKNQVMQNDRLHAIATLAAGVAHEVNNPLTGMINFSQLIYDKIDNEKLKRYAWSIIKEGNRIGNIVRKLLAYSGYREETKVLLNPVDALKDALSLLRSTFRSEFIIVHTDKKDNIPVGFHNTQQLEQIFINLLLNARDALNKKYPGYHKNKMIEITATPDNLAGKSSVIFIIKDNGIGISNDIFSKIFEPGISTKKENNNGGLGLVVCKEIMDEINGEISLISKPCESAAFKLSFPSRKK